MSQPTPQEVSSLVLLATTTACFVAHFYFLSASAWQKRADAALPPQRDAVERHRWSGLVVMGLLPLGICAAAMPWPAHHYGLGLPDPLATLKWCAMALVMAPVSWRGAAQPQNWAAYPEDRSDGLWTSARLRRNALTWAPYLVGYESLFRGVLFLGLAAELGPWLAGGVSTSLYVLAHLHKPAAETIGSALAGVVFAAATWHSGSIWAVVFTHIVIAAGAESAAARAQEA